MNITLPPRFWACFLVSSKKCAEVSHKAIWLQEISEAGGREGNLFQAAMSTETPEVAGLTLGEKQHSTGEAPVFPGRGGYNTT